MQHKAALKPDMTAHGRQQRCTHDGRKGRERKGCIYATLGLGWAGAHMRAGQGMPTQNCIHDGKAGKSRMHT